MPSTHVPRFRANLDRVRGLVTLYEEVTAAAPGRASVRESDLLRAAVVLLHAALEDLIRGLAAARLPTSSAEVLAEIPVKLKGGSATAMKVTLGDLAAHRGRSIDDVIAESIGAYLERSNYN